jgi:undecaprenyl-diphosphatase
VTLLNLAILALIQGITEFLPISSSGHLLLFPTLMGVADQGLSIDVAVHVGTLAAVMLYFRRDVGTVVVGSLDIARGRTGTDAARLAWYLAIATIPVVIAGVAFAAAGLDDVLRAPGLAIWVVAATTLLWGVVLWLVDRASPMRREAGGWSMRDAVLMGLAQALAIVPGTSRSGITMTAARALGFDRVEAARLSMLMSVPAIAAAGLWLVVKLIRDGDVALGLDAALGAGLAFVSALAALTVMMRMLSTWTFLPFVLYRLALGAVLVVVALG